MSTTQTALYDGVVARPIVLIGSPRSGTTFLGKLLSAHPAVHYLSEPRLTWRYGNDAKSDRLTAADARPEVVRHIRDTFGKAVAEAGKERLLEKTPANALRPGFVDAVLPDARFVHITRHGLDATFSIRAYWRKAAQGGGGRIAKGRLRQRLKEVELRRLPHYAKEVARRFAPKALTPMVGQNVWGPRLPGIEGLLKDLDLLEVCALQWRTCVELTREFGRSLPAERYLELRLEDLDPAELDRVLKFCDLPDDPAVRAVFDAQYDPGAAGARKLDADEAEVAVVMPWLRGTLEMLGYEVR